MRWHHGHSWAAGIITGIILSQHAVLLMGVGALLAILFSKIGAIFRAINRRLNSSVDYSVITGKKIR